MPFKGVPISSHSQTGEIPVEVVSQPSYKDIEAKLNASYEEKSNETSTDDILPKRDTSAFNVSTEPEAERPRPEKEEAVRSGQINISELLPADFDDFMHASIVALPKRMPTMLDVRCKDPNFRPRWVNCKADGGRRVDECKAMGFSIAKPEEIITRDGLPLEDSVMIQPGSIKYHDVILMKVPTRLMFGWLKQNAIDSSNKVSPTRLHQAAKAEAQKTVRQGISDEGYSSKQMHDMVKVYVPGESEVPNK